jgi:hypothetical protein
MAAALAGGCATIPAPSETLVRLHNASGVSLDAVSATFSGHVADYGRIPAGATTDYRPAPGAYRYAFIAARVDGERYVLQPIDYVGEQPLGPGRFTYAIDVDRQNHSLTVTSARRDD